MFKKNIGEPGAGSCPKIEEGGTVVCPACHHRIEKLTDWRCPRCNSSLIKMGCTGNCRTCGT